ncbi:glutamate 5-kinase [Anaerovibrio sp.]|uniref:glutamate 5-kinase n=1 Tax=Anaerovibrio sp. TaxID=1872532 RepID=UPI00261EB672|nr:glutamate 5-kinase [Anaerovibrio sp.]MDD6596924.1 glutamate 5-kinase [Anaerovibrio sp.]MDD7677035.1 glutamate 5-kinase [Anaerovibrio sp.]MDY2603364.1 glutamate 5-kinase [Anaerovibrio sp.]MDY4884032.1 glutamate 5-kinase [Anaerovibrio sp.]
MNTREQIKDAKRIVVKVGTSTLLYPNGKINLYRIEHLARELSDLASQGREVILVTSGAIGAGMVRMGLSERPDSMQEKQALASVGQVLLMHLYDKFFTEYGQVAGQVLLTKENFANHNQYINARNTLMAMLKNGIIPVINENDAVTVAEVKIGDNDTLSATVAAIVDADVLIILSDIDGVYDANPQTHPEARLLSEIKEITSAVEAMAGGAGSSVGTGGMATKIEAAKIATAAGVTMFIASGGENGMLSRIIAGEDVGTVFPPKDAHLRARKGWLAFGKRISGILVVDEGCVKALKRGSSLLAAGILATEGEYSAGSTVRVLTADYQEIARGTIAYDASAVAKIKGRKTSDFTDILDGEIHDEVIHRDNMVLMI